MKRSIYIWLSVLAGVVLLSGLLISNTVVEKKVEKATTISQVDDNGCASSCDDASKASYAQTTEASSKSCPYASSCGSSSNAVHASSGSKSGCTYKSSEVKMAKENTTKEEEPALTSAE